MSDMCCKHYRTTYEHQRSKQVTAASSLTPLEVLDRLYSVPFARTASLEVKHLKAICEGKGGTEVITIPDSIANAIHGVPAGTANVGQTVRGLTYCKRL